MKPTVLSHIGQLFIKKAGNANPPAEATQNKLMFVFQGRNGNYKSLGQELFRENKVFRETIERCHKVCSSKFGFDLLHIFEDPTFDLQTATELDVFIALSSIQCALTDLYYSEKIIPELIVAMSLGEAAASYAAGAYSLEDAVSIAFYIFATCEHMGESCTLFMVNISVGELTNLLEEAAGTLFHFAEFTATKRVLCCSNKNIGIVSDIILRNKISNDQMEYHGAYHTPYLIDEIKKQKTNILDKFESINYLPLKIPFHTCMFKKALPAGTLLNGPFWVDMLTEPVLFGRVIANTINSGFNIYLNVGAHPKLSEDIKTCAADINKKITILDSFRKNEPESLLISNTLNQLKKLSVSKTVQSNIVVSKKMSDLIL